MSDLNMSHGIMSDFVSFSFFVFTLVIKLRTFRYENFVFVILFKQNCGFNAKVSLPLAKCSPSSVYSACVGIGNTLAVSKTNQ